MKRLGITTVMVFATGCLAQSGSTLSIMDAIAPDAQCRFSSTATDFLGYGILDPHGYGTYAPSDYILYLMLQNRAFATTDDPANLNSPGGAPINVRPDANDITVYAFEVCWDLASNHIADSGALDCSKVPADQRAVLPTTMTVEVASKSAVAVRVLGLDALRAAGMYGTTFDPVGIPEQGKVATVGVGPVPTSFSLPLASSAAQAGRPAQWGLFPADPYNTSRVIVALKAKGHNMVGTDIDSNWFYFPIDVIPGYLASLCGQVVYWPSCGAANLAQYIGNFVDMSTSCLPGDGGIGVQCLTISSCSDKP